MESANPTARLPNRSPKDGTIRGQGIQSPTAGFHLHGLPAYDLIVIGGGINGTGIAREAALRGLQVLLLEKNDFGSGTSAYSSRLIHGGLRYLANLELDLVYESLAERALLLKNAPHLVRPMAMGLPVHRGNRMPIFMIGLGLLLYDVLSCLKTLPWHRVYGPQSFLGRYPQVNPHGLRGGAVYYDAQVDFPELICVENAMAAKETGNASVLNHAVVTGIFTQKNRMGGVYFQDTLSGQTYVASAKCVINAAGPWLDQVIGLVSETPVGGAAPVLRLGGTKGSHIVVRRFNQAPETALYVEAKSDGRPFFIIPWREDFYLIGTTDIPFAGDLDQVSANPDEVAYLLSETNQVLPQANLTPADVLYTYAGVRPLPAGKHQRTGKISRKHWIEHHAEDKRYPLPGLVSVIGGKLTTYRNLSKVTVDEVVKAYQLALRNSRHVPASGSRNLPLPGGKGISSIEAYKQLQMPQAVQRFQVDATVVSHCIDLYGSRFEQVLALTEENLNWRQPVAERQHDILAQVIYAVRAQMALTVSDVMLRRIGCGLDADAGFNALEPVARCMGAELGWDESKIQQEMAIYRHFIQARHLNFREIPAPV
ncbi:glycerol-3-phosphate dehydrogenase/oxidase [Vampirovibrio sp.]|uniref:glycerol-3-phosphate dehydrogenase/oxidase n=1 Tax=Vampirovibrio sp. TaxID=2717857 RepID=UPI003593E05F